MTVLFRVSTLGVVLAATWLGTEIAGVIGGVTFGAILLAAVLHDWKEEGRRER